MSPVIASSGSTSVVPSSFLLSAVAEFAANHKWSLYALAAVAFLYWFMEPPRRNATYAGTRYPFFANLFSVIKNHTRFHDWLSDLSRTTNGKAFVLSMPCDDSPVWVVTTPDCVRHVTKDKFDCYIKSGSESIREILGSTYRSGHAVGSLVLRPCADRVMCRHSTAGILAVNGASWRHQRKVHSLMFAGRMLAEHCENVFATKGAELVQLLRVYSVPAAAGGQLPVIDMSDIFSRVTMDVISQVGFGRMDSTLSMYPKSDTLTNAFDSIQTLLTSRLKYPTMIWRKMRDWQIGENERRLTVVLRTFNAHVMSIVNTRRAAPKIDRMKYHDIISSFLLAAEEKGEPAPDDTYLRDVTAALIFAGRDTTCTPARFFVPLRCC